MTFWALAWAPLEVVMNRALTLDPVAVQRMAPLLGKVVAVEIIGLPRMCVVFHSGAVRLLSDAGVAPHVTLQASLSQLVSAAARRTADSSAAAGAGIAVNGDVGTVRDLQAWLDAFHVDWEERLAGVVGPELARPVARVLDELQQWARNVGATVRRDVEEYLKEESDLVPDASAVNAFSVEVEQVRDDTERLAARIQRLRAAT